MFTSLGVTRTTLQTRYTDSLAESPDLMRWNTFADLDVPDERLADARRFARSHLLGMLVQRQLTSLEPDPGSELSALCVATLHVVFSTEAT